MPDFALLMAALLVGHCLGDFSPLSTARMLEAKRTATGTHWILVHAGVHAALVGAIVYALSGPTPGLLAFLIAVELGTHFALDLGRALIGVRKPEFNDVEKRTFWYLLGMDQLGHGLVLVYIATRAVGG